MPAFVIIKMIKRSRYYITITKDRRVLNSHVLMFSFTLGVSGKMSTESAGEDDNFGTESSQQVWEYLQGFSYHSEDGTRGLLNLEKN